MSPVNVTAIGSYIREQREQARISLRQLAQAAGVSNPYLSQIERGLRKPSADILQQIAKGLRISAEALYVQAGFLEDRPPGQGVREAVLTDPELNERQKQMLLEIYDSFRNEAALGAEDLEAAGPDDAGLDPAALAWPEMAAGVGEAVLEQPGARQSAGADETAADEAALEEAVLEEAVLEEAIQEAVLEEAVAEEAAREEAALEDAILQRAIQERAAQEQRAAHEQRAAQGRRTAKQTAKPTSGTRSTNGSRAGRARPSTTGKG